MALDLPHLDWILELEFFHCTSKRKKKNFAKDLANEGTGFNSHRSSSLKI